MKEQTEYTYLKNGQTILITERELRLIANCREYTNGDPAGLPGHNLMIIVAKLADVLGIDKPDPEVSGWGGV